MSTVDHLHKNVVKNKLALSTWIISIFLIAFSCAFLSNPNLFEFYEKTLHTTVAINLFLCLWYWRFKSAREGKSSILLLILFGLIGLICFKLFFMGGLGGIYLLFTVLHCEGLFLIIFNPFRLISKKNPIPEKAKS